MPVVQPASAEHFRGNTRCESLELMLLAVEEVVDDLRAPSPNSTVLPHWTVSVVVEAPGGARPSYAHGYYGRDNAFYTAWDAIAGDRDGFRAWMKEHVLDG